METIGEFVNRMNPNRNELGLRNTKYYDYRRDVDPIVWEVTLTGHSDYSGDAVHHSNCEVLKMKYPNIVSVKTFDYGGEVIYLDPEKVLTEDTELATELLYDLASMKNDTILDDEHHSEYIMELQSEAIYEWAESEVRRETTIGAFFISEEALKDIAFCAFLEVDDSTVIVEQPHQAYLDEDKMKKAFWTYVKQFAEARLAG